MKLGGLLGSMLSGRKTGDLLIVVTFAQPQESDNKLSPDFIPSVLFGDDRILYFLRIVLIHLFALKNMKVMLRHEL